MPSVLNIESGVVEGLVGKPSEPAKVRLNPQQLDSNSRAFKPTTCSIDAIGEPLSRETTACKTERVTARARAQVNQPPGSW